MLYANELLILKICTMQEMIPMTSAAQNGDMNAARFLIDNGVDVNVLV
jgi:hypothetical protein